uniref:Rest-a_0 protein n=1 Tax=Fopius arisanus TaxID=64838 RepID=A0A0C9RR23_9HYME
MTENSIGNHEPTPKRQKIDSINPSTPEIRSPRTSKWESSCLIRELEVYRTRLSNTEVAMGHLQKMKEEVERAFLEREQMLEMQLRVEGDTMRNLEDRLELAKRGCEEICESEVTVEAEFFSRETRIREKIESLFSEDPTLNRNALFLQTEKIENVEGQMMRMEMKVDGGLKKNMGTHESQGPGREGVDDSKISRADDLGNNNAILLARARELEKQLESAKNTILTFRQVENEKNYPGGVGPTGQRDLGAVEGVDQSGEHEENERTPEITASRVPDGVTSVQDKLLPQACGICKDMKASEDEGERNSQQESTNTSPDKLKKGENSRLNIKNYYILVSHPKFFEINWEKYYRPVRCGGFTCTQCFQKKSSKSSMQDHIWIEHFKERFLCPFCSNVSLFISRYNVGYHIRTRHSSDFFTQQGGEGNA